MTQARPAGGRAVQTHGEAVEQFRRPFAPSAIGFRIMRQLEDGSVLVAPHLRAQSVIVRLNSLVPGRWAMRFDEFQLDLNQVGGGARLFLVCRLTVTLPREAGGPEVDVTYEDVGEADSTAHHPVKALYSDARKRAGAVAGIGTCLYTVIPETKLPVDGGEVVHAVDGELLLTAEAVRRLRGAYQERISQPAITNEFGELLAHGEPGEVCVDPGRSQPVATPPTTRLPEPQATAADAPQRDVPQTDGFAGWGAGRPTPPPAPVALARDAADPAAVRQPVPTVRATPAMSADHVEEICSEAQRAQVSTSALASIALEVSGKRPVSEEAAAREFDSGLLNRTPDALFARVLAAVRARGGDRLDARGSQPAAGSDGTVPLDFGGLSDDGA